MPGSLTQEQRHLQVETTLGPDELIVRSIRGREAISQMFEIELELASENFQIDSASVISKPVSVSIALDESRKRYISGFVKQFSLLPSADRHAHYHAIVVPWLWFLTRISDCAIFQQQSVPEIVEAIFRKYGFTDFELKLNNTYAQREYCVQYRESAFKFVSRLLEEEGISYYFEHSPAKHTLILVDNPGGHPRMALEPVVSWEPGTGSGFAREENYIYDWVRQLNVRSTQWAQTDFNFEKPRFNLASIVPGLSRLPVPHLELYDYPGRFDSRDRGESLTKLRMEEEECAIDTVLGKSACRQFVPGFIFEVQNHFRRDQNGKYLLTSVDYEAEQGSLYGGDAGKEVRYENRFSAIPSTIPLRPPRITLRTYIRGPQTALVTGPPGEEIYVDQYGRVKVQFHWDRQGQYDSETSC